MDKLVRFVIGGALICAWCDAEKWDEFASFDEYFQAKGLSIPVEHLEKAFHSSQDKANFTFFHGVENVAVKAGKLTFTATSEKVVLGWGNTMGRQSVAEIASLWEERNDVVIRVKQSGSRSTWQLKYWADGRAQSNQPEEAVLSGTDWQETRFEKAGLTLPTPDGIELTITVAGGTTFELDWIKFVQPRHEGYMRHEFQLPRGKIWKAVADVGSGNDRVWFMRNKMNSRLYLNGTLVERRIPKGLYATVPVDLTKYLQPGVNCAAFYGYRVGYTPVIYLQATVIMESGEVIRIQTDQAWRFSPKEQQGWQLSGFDDSAWSTSERSQGVWESHQLMPPAYAGRIDLRNPYKKDLFYADTRNVLINVLVPRGLASVSPRLEYTVNRAGDDGTLEASGNGAVSFFEEQSPSIIYRLDFGQLPRGVYALGLRLVGEDGTVLEERAPEPFVVLRKQPLRLIQGTDYREGLDLELEDRIDFTDPADSHPWIEGRAGLGPMQKVEKPRIIRKNGLLYREVTGEKRASWFSYRFAFKHPGDFYLLALEYPDDADRVIEVSLSTKMKRVWTNSQAGLGAETGGKFHKTGTMQKLQWIHVADSGVHSVDILNVLDGWRAAAASLEVYHIRGDLPSVGAGSSRSYGIHTERCYATSGIGMNFGVDMPKPRLDRDEQPPPLPKMQQVIRDLVWMEQTCERYVQYLKFSGQNLLLMGCIQYNEYNTPFIPVDNTRSPRITRCMKTMMANVLDMNAIDFLAGLEFSNSSDIRTFSNNAQVANGAESLWMIDSAGRQFYGIERSTVVPNWQHPGFKERYHSVLNEVFDTFGGLKHFRGVSNFFGPTQRTNYYFPAYGMGSDWDQPLAYSYDDITFANFQEEAGIDIPIGASDPKRFSKRAALAANPRFRQQFLDWRCRKLRDVFAAAVAALNQRRDDLQFVNLCAVEEARCFKQLMASKRTFAEMLKDFAIDIPLLGRIENMTVVRWTISWRQSTPLPSQDPFCWIARERDVVLSAFRDLPRRAVLCRTSWDENVQIAPGHTFVRGQSGTLLEGSDWVFDAMRIRALPQPGGFHAREALIQAIITADPQLLLTGFTDLNVNVGHEQVLREVMRVFTHLPAGAFERVLNTGLETNLAIRKLDAADGAYLYVANPGYWHVEGAVQLSAATALLDLTSGRSITAAGDVTLEVKLPPYGLAAYRTTSGSLAVNSYEVKPIDAAELAHMTGILTRVDTLLSDAEARLALSPDDRAFMRTTVAKVRAVLADRQYAQAWSMLKHHRFWSGWQDFLEKAAAALALLPESVEQEQAPADPDSIRRLRIARADSAVTVDGNLNEPDWGKAVFSGAFRTREGGLAMNQTAVKALYDDENLYLAFMCADRNPRELKAVARQEKDIFAAQDDVLAIFVQPDAATPLYYQMAFNSKGIQFDQRVKGGERDYDYHPAWQAAVAVQDNCWSAEVKLPFQAFGLAGRGDTPWRMNFFRVMRNSVLPPTEWCLAYGQWHSPDRFGRVEFSE